MQGVDAVAARIKKKYQQVRDKHWQVESQYRKAIKNFGYWRNRTKWNIRNLLIITGIRKGRAYYVSAAYGNDENSGESIFDPVRTYDRGQDLAEEWEDIIIVIDRDSENMKPWYLQRETGNCWGVVEGYKGG